MCNCSKRDRLILYHSPPSFSLSLSSPLGAANFCQSGICSALTPLPPVPLPFSLPLFTFICPYLSFLPLTPTTSSPLHTSSWHPCIYTVKNRGWRWANQKMWKVQLFSSLLSLSLFRCFLLSGRSACLSSLVQHTHTLLSETHRH